MKTKFWWLLLAVTLTVTQLDQGFVVSGKKNAPQHLAPNIERASVIVPYNASTQNILDSLRLFKGIYYFGGAVHGAYLGLH